MKIAIIVVVLLAWSTAAPADDGKFSTHLFAKFQTRGCTACHDFFEKERNGLAFNSHKGRSAGICVACHKQEVTGFRHSDDWFAQPGLYTSGMDARQTCEATRTALHAEFKNKTLVARQLEQHLLTDPRVLWGIAGATPQSGLLPGGAKEQDLVQGGLAKWKEQVRAWIAGGMQCQ